MNFEYFGYYMITAFGQAATTFTGQNYAAKETDRCKQILIRSLLLSFLFSTAITLPLTILGTCVLRIVWIFTVFAHFHTLESLFIVFPISWGVTILLMFLGFLILHPLHRC